MKTEGGHPAQKRTSTNAGKMGFFLKGNQFVEPHDAVGHRERLNVQSLATFLVPGYGDEQSVNSIEIRSIDIFFNAETDISGIVAILA